MLFLLASVSTELPALVMFSPLPSGVWRMSVKRRMKDYLSKSEELKGWVAVSKGPQPPWATSTQSDMWLLSIYFYLLLSLFFLFWWFELRAF
jgi:hypothetical protein